MAIRIVILRLVICWRLVIDTLVSGNYCSSSELIGCDKEIYQERRLAGILATVVDWLVLRWIQANRLKHVCLVYIRLATEESSWQMRLRDSRNN